MEDFRDQGLLRHQLECLNACQMYLEVTTLAEITDHTRVELLPQILSSPMKLTPPGLTNISSSTIRWPNIHLLTTPCWKLWIKTIRTIYTGSTQGTRLLQPLGEWLPLHSTYRFWNWRMHSGSQLAYKHSPSSNTHVALATHNRRTYMKFTPTVPTTIAFQGPPITLVDMTIGLVRLPVVDIITNLDKPKQIKAIATIQKQF